jgi:1-deoxy-D-xylulose-5-phosphate reductoisomerase
MDPARRIAVLGSTGSIGVNTLKVAAGLKKKIEVVALSADSSIKLLAEQARIFKPKVISVRDAILASKIRDLVPSETEVLFGAEGLNDIVSRNGVDIVVFAISGSSCLIPLIRAISQKKTIALASKEALVSAGSLIMRLAEKRGVPIIPIDSEHSAIFQCLKGERKFLKRIYLTATGGPLLNVAKNRFDRLSRRFILKHPKWAMGRKISVDSATMMNKGLEIIEARWLFSVDESMIEVLVHPEAIVHSMVELADGTVFAQLGAPDMRLPIQYALTYPARFAGAAGKVNFSGLNLSFKRPDPGKFPCLALAREALKKGGTYPAVLNASDEEAVRFYLEGRIKFSRIPYIIEKVIGRHKDIARGEPSLGDICNAERWAREETAKLCYR